MVDGKCEVGDAPPEPPKGRWRRAPASRSRFWQGAISYGRLRDRP
ncbi:hypothetical protein [Scytonema sp. PRP1]